MVCVGIGALSFFFVPNQWQIVTKLLITLNIAFVLEIFTTINLLRPAGSERFMRLVRNIDPGIIWIFIYAALVATTCLAGITIFLGSEDMKGTDADIYIKFLSIVFVVVTILVSWFFLQLTFAVHYANQFVSSADKAATPNLDFSGGDKPDISDFLYFSITIGIAMQTSDVAIRSRRMRRSVLAHAVFSFFLTSASWRWPSTSGRA